MTRWTKRAVLKQLAYAEKVAASKGQAIAIGHPHPATLAAIRAWMPKAEARGFVIVPLSAVAKLPSRRIGLNAADFGTRPDGFECSVTTFPLDFGRSVSHTVRAGQGRPTGTVPFQARPCPRQARVGQAGGIFDSVHCGDLLVGSQRRCRSVFEEAFHADHRWHPRRRYARRWRLERPHQWTRWKRPSQRWRRQRCLDGGAGNDTLFGGTHNDTLLGGLGNDRTRGRRRRRRAGRRRWQ